MFFQDREATMKTIGVLGYRSCAYFVPSGIMPGGEPETEDQSIARWVAPGHRCDCKYSYAGVQQGLMRAAGSENTGCPELRSVYKALSLLTDDEWAELASRADGIITGRFFSTDPGPTRDRALLKIRQIIDGLPE